MSRVIKTESAGKDRTQLSRSILRAVQELGKQTMVDDKTRDLASFIGLALHAISQTIDASVAAWEKRGYWIKADRFRMEWEWAGRLGDKMCQAVLADDWGTVALTTAQVAEKLKGVQVLKRQPKDEPWAGAWTSLQAARLPKH